MALLDLQLSTSLLFCLVPLLFLFFVKFKKTITNTLLSSNNSSKIPRSYPLIGSYFSILANHDRRIKWISDIILTTPNLTFTLIRPLNFRTIFTANPSNVQHVLKTNFQVYQKGHGSYSTLKDFLSNGIFNVDGDIWKYQRQVASHEFNTRSLRKFVETVVDTELSERLIPILATAAANKTVLDFQDILQRFAFDNICKIAFGYDPGYLLPSLPEAEFAVAFEDAVRLSTERFIVPFSLIWKIKRALNIGSEKKLRVAVEQVREFAKEIVREKQKELNDKSSLDSADLLSRFLSTGHSDEDFVTDIVISFILAGRDTTSAALTWFFWLISKHPEVESQIMKEVGEKSESLLLYDEVKNMMYTHASLCESMRFYPPVPMDSKEATKDDILPDGTFVKKGTRVTYHPYAMGRVEKVWGEDWAEFKPERWLDKDEVTGNWTFVPKDAYTYPVFQAGPRICLGKEMAFLQMKRVVAGVLRRFKVVPVVEQGVEPVFISYLTAKMKGGFPVTIEERI
ncbi:cytochrome P450 94A1-like [Nicotiana tabacum]|uniref:Cytochrome P450 94A1-like n=2 Tax=Nicotiana TaxID=4085 RepID=Q8W2N1_TOBAC|nr:cytochrome P450 94A1-like [Nicotiana tabacum]XP_009763713.1 PREDICTED: cytochrome P450 94A1-like isoform X1 [Nicotiana sylvestris]XP_009763715.1 PREDICTED: cytochrome P450 94A1-like isoform X2 [Nicotiana sylvestris]AAL54887.1 cytochrome P450-dependent fatty acid hydroxylase [Nicotiana tabacum]